VLHKGEENAGAMNEKLRTLDYWKYPSLKLVSVLHGFDTRDVNKDRVCGWLNEWKGSNATDGM
jgi:hypothetical protein